MIVRPWRMALQRRIQPRPELSGRRPTDLIRNPEALRTMEQIIELMSSCLEIDDDLASETQISAQRRALGDRRSTADAHLEGHPPDGDGDLSRLLDLVDRRLQTFTGDQRLEAAERSRDLNAA